MELFRLKNKLTRLIYFDSDTAKDRLRGGSVNRAETTRAPGNVAEGDREGRGGGGPLLRSRWLWENGRTGNRDLTLGSTGYRGVGAVSGSLTPGLYWT